MSQVLLNAINNLTTRFNTLIANSKGIVQLPSATNPILGADSVAIYKSDEAGTQKTPVSDLPISDDVQAALNLKEDIANKGVANGYVPLNASVIIASTYLDIINDLTTGGTTSLLSAEQGKILKGFIDGINTLLTSDNINLDTIQEIVDAIENVQTWISTILVNDLTTGGVTKALTAEQGKVLKDLIDSLLEDLSLQKEVTTATYTILPEDNRQTIFFNNATGITVTVDNTLPSNFSCDFYNLGVGSVTFVAGTATLGTPDGTVLATDKVAALIKFMANNNHKLKGELT